MRARYEAQGVKFLAVSIEPDLELVRGGAARMGIQMPVAVSLQETLGPLAVNAVPSTVFVDEAGVIVAAVNGVRKRDFFERRVRDLLEK